MKRIKELTNWAIAIEDESLAAKKDVRGWLRFVMRLTTYTSMEFVRDEVTEMAAALTYRTIFSLIPVLVLAFLLIRAVGGFDKISDDLRQRAFRYLGISQLALPSIHDTTSPTISDTNVSQANPDDTLANPQSGADAGNAAGGNSPPTSGDSAPASGAGGVSGIAIATGPVIGSASTQPTTRPALIPVTTKAQQQVISNRLEVILSDLTNQVSTISFASIGGVGFLLLVWSALSLAVTVEQTFNRIYNTSIGRPWHLRIALYWAVITLGPFLLTISIYLTSRIVAIVETVGPFASLLKFASRLAALCVSWLLLFIIYKLMPNTRVDSRSAAIGSFIAAFLFEGGKFFFHLYLTHFVPFSKFYGTLALLPLFLLWVYTMWIIVLAGLEFSYTLQAMLSGDFKHQYLRRNQMIYQDPRVLGGVLASIARDFREGKPVSARMLHNRLGISTNDINHALERLENGGLIHRAKDLSDPTTICYTLSRPAEKILLRELYFIATPLSHTPAGHLPIVDDPAYGWIEKTEHVAPKS